MGKTYELADDRDLSLLREAMRKWHKPLDDCGAEIAVVMVSPNKTEGGEPTAPAVTFAGAEAPCRTYLEATSRRVQTRVDARILVDAERWKALDRDAKLATMDHALSWLDVKLAKDPDTGVEKAVVHDDDRPKLVLRHPDGVSWWFEAVLKRHGSKSFECGRIATVKTLVDAAGQNLWDFGQRTEAAETDDDDTGLGISESELAEDGAGAPAARDDGFGEDEVPEKAARMPLQLTGPAAERAHVDRTRGRKPRRAAAKKPERKTPRRNGKH